MRAASVSIIYVNYKTPHLLNASIDSIKTFTKKCNYEIIVVDNKSDDNSKEIITNCHKDIVWIDAGYNSGFARGNNKGIEISRNEFVLIINSDTLLETDAISMCLDKYITLSAEENIGLLGCKILSFDKQVLPSVHSNFHGVKSLIKSNPIYIKFFSDTKPNETENKDWYNTNHFAAHISGAFMLFSKKKLGKKQLWLDEDYFLYAEDVDWCYRLQQHGLKSFFFSDAYILHKDAASSSDAEKKNFQIIISRWLFVFKAYGLFYFYGYIALLRFNLLLDDILYFKTINRTNEHLEAHQYRSTIKRLIAKYGVSMPFKFKRAPSSSNHFLQYDRQN